MQHQDWRSGGRRGASRGASRGGPGASSSSASQGNASAQGQQHGHGHGHGTTQDSSKSGGPVLPKPGQIAIFGARKLVEQPPARPGPAGHAAKGDKRETSGAMTRKKTAKQHQSAKQDKPLKIMQRPAAPNSASAQATSTLSSSTTNKKQSSASQAQGGPEAATKHKALKASETCCRLIDDQFRWVSSSSSDEKLLLQADNESFRVIGTIGLQGSGKSSILNAIMSRESFPVSSHEDGRHCTRGVQLDFSYLGAERVWNLDTQPVCSPSVVVDLVREVDVLAEHRESHAVLGSMHNLQLAVFLLSTCDVLLVVEDALCSDNRAVWELIRLAYIVIGGNDVGQNTADLVLVRNRTPEKELGKSNLLTNYQNEWNSFFSDIVPPNATKPRLFFFVFPEIEGGLTSGTGREHTSKLRQLLLFQGFCETSPASSFELASPCSVQLDQLLFLDEDNSDSGEAQMETFSVLKPLDASLDKAEPTSQDRPVLPDQGPYLGRTRRKEAEFLQHAALLWSKTIPEFVQMKEFGAVFRAQEASIL